MPKLRKCLYRGNKYYFHRWFQEGGFERNNGIMEGGIDIGAILEREQSGKILKVYDVENIELKGELDD